MHWSAPPVSPIDSLTARVPRVPQDPTPLKLWSANVGPAAEAVLATLGPAGEPVELPPAADDLHIHLSTPCTELSPAKHSAAHADVAGGLAMLQWALELVLDRGERSWSLENVSTPQTRALLADFQSRFPDQVAYATFDAADFGAAQTRSRLIAGPPQLIRLLHQMPSAQRLAVRHAFEAHGLALPAPCFKNQTRNRDGTPCLRSVEQQSHTVCSSHALTWCESDGRTVKVMSAGDSAVLMGFPLQWRLPAGCRVAQKAVGNALCVQMSQAICTAALSLSTGQPVPALPALPALPAQVSVHAVGPDELSPIDAGHQRVVERLLAVEAQLRTIETLLRRKGTITPTLLNTNTSRIQ